MTQGLDTDQAFFSQRYPTRSPKSILKAVCQCLSGMGGKVASIIRLNTQYGGGETLGLIALIHAVRSMERLDGAAAFIDPSLLPGRPVRLAALDDENSVQCLSSAFDHDHDIVNSVTPLDGFSWAV